MAASVGTPAIALAAFLTCAVAASAQEDPKIKVEKFIVKGAAGLSEEEVRAVVEPYEGSEMTLEEIREVARVLTLTYTARGHILSMAYVPEQEIKDGVVEIAVVEGVITKADLRSAPEHYSAGFLSEYAERLFNDPDVAQEDIERILLNLNDLPGLEVLGFVEPGEEAGSSVFAMDFVENHPFWMTFHYDNFGSPEISEHRASATLGLANLWDAGHWITVTNTVGFPVDHLWAIRTEYHAPVGTDGLILAAAYSHFEYEAGGVVAVLDPTGDGDAVDVWATYPILRKSGLELMLDGGLEWKVTEQKLLGTTLSNDRLSVIRAGLNFECDDDLGRNYAGVGIRRGIAGFLGSMDSTDDDASRVGAGGEFTKAEFSFARVQPVTDWFEVVGRFNAQWAVSNDPLVLSEMFGIGGPNSVRGYRIYEFSGDRGFGWGVELRLRPAFLDEVEDPFKDVSAYKLTDMIQMVLFYDYGQAKRFDPLPGEDDFRALDGWGAGIRLGYPEWVSIRYDVGFPIGGPSPVSGDAVEHYVSVDVSIKF